MDSKGWGERCHPKISWLSKALSEAAEIGKTDTSKGLQGQLNFKVQCGAAHNIQVRLQKST